MLCHLGVIFEIHCFFSLDKILIISFSHNPIFKQFRCKEKESRLCLWKLPDMKNALVVGLACKIVNFKFFLIGVLVGTAMKERRDLHHDRTLEVCTGPAQLEVNKKIFSQGPAWPWPFFFEFQSRLLGFKRFLN